MKTKRMIIAAAATAALAGSALADLTGTSLDATLTNSGFIGMALGPSGGTHDWGTLDTFAIGAISWDLSSPSSHPSFDNAMTIDFTDFQYFALTTLGPSWSTLTVTGLDEELESGSVAVFLPSNLNSDIAFMESSSSHGFSVTWDVGTVVGANPIAPQVVVAWNSVPTPGALALLGLAGMVGGGRRRRDERVG